MGRILLTPSQVSVLLSGGIVLLCTVALFLSGYAIQQRTLRDLRVAIRPRQTKSAPKPFLPDRFKKTRVQLEDGTWVMMESEAEREAKGLEPLVIEVKTTMPPPKPERRQDEGEASAEKLAIIEMLKAQVAEKSWAVPHPDPLAMSRVPITRVERRRLIKEEFQRLEYSSEQGYPQKAAW